MNETVKWTIRDGHLLAVHVADMDTEPAHLGVLTVDGWVEAPSRFPLSEPARPDYHFPAVDEKAALKILAQAGADSKNPQRR